ncbi:MAG: GntR family transcriptional regulator [Clostridia bacterium]|nr:GntR family transcriptional regulator [Clostridia bacterium]
MKILINYKSGTPIYEQIYSQLKNQIISGAASANEVLPSIRSLAKDLGISVITTKRAYDELEREGFIYTVAGKGSFVAQKNIALIREDNLRKIENLMQQINELAVSCNLSKAEVIEMYKIISEEE